ncbi:MAG: hypothetical protein AAF235_00680 [Planctomycetota bacterium]
MKSLLTVIGVVAVANLLALGGVVAWLAATDRLNGDRIERTRELFVEPVSLEEARTEQEQREALAAEAEAELEPSGPPVTSSESLALRLELSELDRERLERLRREVDDLQRSLSRDRQLLDRERENFEDERKRFEAMRDRLSTLEGGEQFRKALGSIEGMKPDDARVTLQTLLDQGEREQVVSYLNAMQERTRTKIMSSWVKDDQPDVAADLLEALRVRGLETAAE